jgi:hypothetical protein
MGVYCLGIKTTIGVGFLCVLRMIYIYIYIYIYLTSLGL